MRREFFTITRVHLVIIAQKTHIEGNTKKFSPTDVAWAESIAAAEGGSEYGQILT